MDTGEEDRDRDGQQGCEHTDRPSRLPYGRSHQIADLLAVYYFSLAAYKTGRFPGDVLERNCKTDTAFHSGLDLRPDREALRHKASTSNATTSRQG